MTFLNLGPVLAYSSEGDALLARPVSVSRWLGEMSRALVTHRGVVGSDEALVERALVDKARVGRRLA